jgi:SAM-dependent methyltransferase
VKEIDVAKKLLEVRRAAEEQGGSARKEEPPPIDLAAGEATVTAARAALGEKGGAEDLSGFIPESFFRDPPLSVPQWRKIWGEDVTFRISSHRPVLGPIIIFLKKLLRPIVKTPVHDLFDRQRVFNLAVLSHLENLNRGYDRLLTKIVPQMLDRMDGIFSILDRRIESTEAFEEQVKDEIERRDALLRERLESIAAEPGDPEAVPRARIRDGVEKVLDDLDYLKYENLHRGNSEEIAARQASYLPYFRGADRVLDIGCGRGEFLLLCRENTIGAYGIDASLAMVRVCREKNLEAVHGDALDHLRMLPAASLGGVFSAQVVEHLETGELPKLFRLCREKMKEGAAIVVETQNPLSLVVGASEFYRDPGHTKPLHPEGVKFLLEAAGFRDIEILFSSPFSSEETIPPIEIVYDVPESVRAALDGVNERIARLNRLLFGHRDFAAAARK